MNFINMNPYIKIFVAFGLCIYVTLFIQKKLKKHICEFIFLNSSANIDAF